MTGPKGPHGVFRDTVTAAPSSYKELPAEIKDRQSKVAWGEAREAHDRRTILRIGVTAAVLEAAVQGGISFEDSLLLILGGAQNNPNLTQAVGSFTATLAEIAASGSPDDPSLDMQAEIIEAFDLAKQHLMGYLGAEAMAQPHEDGVYH